MKTRNGFVSNSSSSSYVLIGVPIDERKLFKTVTKRACSCKVGISAESNFCPKCGGDAWREGREPLTYFKPKYGAEDGCGKIGKLEVEEINLEERSLGFFAMAFQAMNEAGGKTFIPYGDLPKFEKLCRETLEPLGLWDAKTFGIYSYHNNA